MEQKIHQGRNVKRFREMLGIKQEALAFDLGRLEPEENLPARTERRHRRSVASENI